MQCILQERERERDRALGSVLLSYCIHTHMQASTMHMQRNAQRESRNLYENYLHQLQSTLMRYNVKFAKQ